jgi:hypothetical protein
MEFHRILIWYHHIIIIIIIILLYVMLLLFNIIRLMFCHATTTFTSVNLKVKAR